MSKVGWQVAMKFVVVVWMVGCGPLACTSEPIRSQGDTPAEAGTSCGAMVHPPLGQGAMGPTVTQSAIVTSRCQAPEAPPTRAVAMAQEAFRGLPSRYPTVALAVPDGRFLLMDARGYVLVLNDLTSAAFQVLLDISEKVIGPKVNVETGLVGAALASGPNPEYLYLAYTTASQAVGAVVDLAVERFSLSDSEPVVESARRILTIPLPTYYHHAGTLAFGPDGYLYVAVGDGGTGANGQDRTTPLGSILRIDPRPDGTYAVPHTNPFVGQSGVRPEIFAYGFRNPWKFSFDRQTGELWVADVGFNAQEEVDLVEAGGNYGWRPMEGNVCPDDCSQFIPPRHAYAQSDGCAVIGGFVYRGVAIPELFGRYVFADYCGRWVRALDTNGEVELVAELPAAPTSFVETVDAELLVLLQNSPAVQLVRNPSRDDPPTLAERLSETGCVDPKDPRLKSAALVPYEVNSPLWSDGAIKQRWVSMPAGETVSVDDAGDLVYPVGTVFVKEFARDGVRLETRLLMRHPSGEWGGYTYRWNAEQTDAYLLETSVVADLGNGHTWLFPSRAQCMQCHNDKVGPILGGQLRQLQRLPDAAGGLAEWQDAGLFDGDYQNVLDGLEPFASPNSEAASLESRARSYLHVNCATCHSDVQAAHAHLDLRFDTPLADTGVCARPSDPLGVRDARIVAAGEPARSVLLARVASASRGRMPKFSRVIDPVGVAMLECWIEQLRSCHDASEH